MQFIKDGPNIPEHLLQAHEDGRVIFFCGAGISYPAGLPGFRGLVDQIYTEIGTSQQPIEKAAYDKGQYDAMLDLLERRLPGQRAVVRAALMKALKPNLRLKGATATHSALLALARDRKNCIRLVTTNFDRIFEKQIKREKLHVQSYPAPLLPIPKSSRWNGLVYLHGLLPETQDESALNRLVLSSGDFGLAYLTERWAARFVGEMFRNYIVCFVGYSISDPVLRYMMDALAADRMLGEATPMAYAFGSYDGGGYEKELLGWEAKGVTPVLYEVPFGTHDHFALHQTLAGWASTYRDGVLGKERIVAQYAVNPPLASTLEDNFVGRILWAISDKSSLPAKRFADLEPVPPLDWLEELTKNHLNHDDLPRFGVPPKAERDNALSFSVARRPAPYTLAPKLALVSATAGDSQWDEIMVQLAHWLIRHLDDPKLILWVAKQGGKLHRDFAWKISRRIQELDEYVAKRNQEEIGRILKNAPKAFPGPIMRTLWHLTLSGRLKSYSFHASLYDLLPRLKHEGMTPILRMELRDMLSPCVRLQEPFRWEDDDVVADAPQRIEDMVKWEVVLRVEHPHSALRDQLDKSRWQNALPDLLHDFNMLLRDCLDLKRQLGGVSDRSDHSFTDQPSISEHAQN